MLTFFTYKTPQKFAVQFKEFYSIANLKQIKVLSMTLFILTFSARILALIFQEEVVKIQAYSEHSLGNWIQLTGAIIFYGLSVTALQSGQWDQRKRKILTLAFILFILVVTFGISYVVSMHNTKNTLLMFLIGIVTVSLFFAIEYRDIIGIAIFIVIVFVLSMVLPKITFAEKITNVIAAFILGFILLCFSRYSYYFKSQHFVQLKQLEEKNLEIERLNIQKDEILGFVAHDLRNPLNNIEALSGLLLVEDAQNSEAERIGMAAKQAKTIINDLIEAVKSDQPNLQTEKQNLNMFLTAIIDKWKVDTERAIELNLSPNLIYAWINPSKLERVLDNLISNGLKFSSPDQSLIVGLTQEENHACIYIKDHGIGIPENLKHYIFKQFTKAGRQGLQGEKSIGLGLHISKTIVEQHNGKLLLKSRENEGTVFTIVLPMG